MHCKHKNTRVDAHKQHETHIHDANSSFIPMRIDVMMYDKNAGSTSHKHPTLSGRPALHPSALNCMWIIEMGMSSTSNTLTYIVKSCLKVTKMNTHTHMLNEIVDGFHFGHTLTLQHTQLSWDPGAGFWDYTSCQQHLYNSMRAFQGDFHTVWNLASPDGVSEDLENSDDSARGPEDDLHKTENGEADRKKAKQHALK